MSSNVRAFLLLLTLLFALPLGSTTPVAELEEARRLVSTVPAVELEERLAKEPASLPATVAGLGRALGKTDEAFQKELGEYLAACARARSLRIARRGTWTEDDLRALLTLQLVDPRRFVHEIGFRKRVLAILPSALDPSAPPRLRDELLFELNHVEEFDFAASDALERAWGAAPRTAAERRVEPKTGEGKPRLFDEAEIPLNASVYSLTSQFFDPAQAETFLAGVRKVAPERTLVVLADLPLRRALEPAAARLEVRLLDTFGRVYTPWPRDPFSLVRLPRGQVRVLVRPNLQTGREHDANLGPELVQNLPEDLDQAWGGVTWSVSPVPFHNGQILSTRDAVWVSLHTLEPRILEILREPIVPVASFTTAEGIAAYVEAATAAAKELGELYGRPVRFVHPLPKPFPPSMPMKDRYELVRRLGGGAGYDLDSIVTLLPRGEGRVAALVADVTAGEELLASLKPEDWNALRKGYRLEPEARELAATLSETLADPLSRNLDGFLDMVASHLEEEEGMEVRRLPLLLVPTTLLREKRQHNHNFLLTWNNVVAETRSGRLRAEGFSSLLPAGDRLAVAAFAAAGAHLDLVPPLVNSITLNGGYRCASNHIRAEIRSVKQANTQRGR